MPSSRTSNSCASVATPRTRSPSGTRRPAAFPAGRTQRRNPCRPASRTRASARLTERTSPVSPTSPQHTTSSGRGRPRTLDATAATTARSAAGSATRRPPATFRNTSWSYSCMRHRFSRTASSNATLPGSAPMAVRRGMASPERDTKAWISTSTGRLPSSVASTAEPGAPAGRSARNAADGILHLDQPAVAHLEDAHLVGGAEAVLHRAQDAQRMRVVALEVEDRVDEVLEHPRAGERALLGDVADQDAGGPARLGVRREERRRLAHLPDAARRRPERGGVHRLDRVHHDHRRAERPDLLDDGLDVRFGQHQDVDVSQPEALGAQPHLLRRLLARDVEDRQPLARQGAARLDGERRLADAGIAADQHDRARDQAAAQHPVELAEPGGAAERVLGGHGRERPRRGARRRARLARRPPTSTLVRHLLLDQRSPDRAAGTLAEPARSDVPALLADERRPARPVNHDALYWLTRGMTGGITGRCTRSTASWRPSWTVSKRPDSGEPCAPSRAAPPPRCVSTAARSFCCRPTTTWAWPTIPAVVAAACEALRRWGCGSGASRLIAGHLALHAEVEAQLAAFKGTEAALLFPSGYQANVGAITALVGRGDHVFSDALNHASIIDGCRLSRASVHVYPHRDMRALEGLLASTPSGGRRLIVTDSVFSMDGDRAPLHHLAALARHISQQPDAGRGPRRRASSGTRGAGLAEAEGLTGEVAVHIGTLGKALGGAGAYVAGSRALIDLVVNRARSFVYTTGLAPRVGRGGGRGPATGGSRARAPPGPPAERRSPAQRPGRRWGSTWTATPTSSPCCSATTSWPCASPRRCWSAACWRRPSDRRPCRRGRRGSA